MTDVIRLTIDGTAVEARPGQTVLEAALDNGIYIPHICYHPDLKPVGVCRLCMVDIAGRPVISCKTPSAEGMAVKTDTPQVSQVRRTAVKLMLKNHHGDCVTCAKNTDCELQRIANFVGVTAEEMERMRGPDTCMVLDRSNPFFDRDFNKCVVCGICVRTCEDIMGVSAIDFVNRGYYTTIGTFGDAPIKESVCVSCGECVARCPVGALIPKHMQPSTREVATVCTYCGCGCGIRFGVRGGRIVSARGDRSNPSNRGNLCVKGRFGYEFVNSPDRLTTPMIKEKGEFREASWDEALDLVASKLKANTGDRTVVLSSAKCTNEDNYVIQKLTRAVIGTNNIDHCARL